MHKTHSPAPSRSGDTLLLPRGENQARGLARYCIDFLTRPGPIGRATLDRLGQFHLDSVG